MDEDRRIPPTATAADDSGILDLRALAAQHAKTSERASLPELYVAPSWAPPAPVTMPGRARSRWAGGAIAATATLAVSMVAFAAVPSLITRVAREPAVVAAPAVPAHDAAPIVTAEPEVAPVVTAPEEVAEPEPAPRPVIAEAPTRPRRASVPAAVRPAPSREPATTEATTPSVDSEIDRLLQAALDGRRPATAATEGLPATPSQRDVTSALRGLERQVAMCREGDGGLASTRVVIDGATGRVQSVRVTGVDAGASACVSDLVETATFPRFAQDTFAVTFPYRL